MATDIQPMPGPVDTTGPQSVFDAQGYAALRAQAAQNSPEALRKVAQEFESLFLNMMLKSMRDAKLGTGVFDGESTKFYEDLYDQQLSMALSHGKGIGIADMLVRSLSARTGHAADGQASTSAQGGGAGAHGERQGGAAALGLPPRRPPRTGIEAVAAGIAAAEGAGDVPAAVPTVPTQPEAATANGSGSVAASPEDFVALVLPHATTAGASLGVDPLVLVAQAALETRWGSHVPATADGSSYNLFGIKADAGWTGKKVAKDTIEFIRGVATRRREPFRAYDSVEHGFSDFVSFLSGNLRYVAAIGSGNDATRFTTALQKAGYATDPSYAAKIQAILGSDTLRRAVSALKNVLPAPIP